MNTSPWLAATAITTASCLTLGAINPAAANTFGNIEVNENNFIAVAAPFGYNQYQLLVIEQIANWQACWRERGTNPVVVEPLLLNFDFTGICGRSTDSNGYSMRVDSQDFGLEYMLRVVKRNGELVLVGTHRIDRNAPDIELGRTRGLANGFLKIFLDPGWRFTKRMYQGKQLGHIYLTYGAIANTVAPQWTSSPQPSPPTPSREYIFTKPQAQPKTSGERFPDTSPQLPAPAPAESSNDGIPVFDGSN
ncbi:DUF3747 domain-containing protein [Moorena sp. SIO4G3]|uniref:DUF3747 domain-containing protein n=1 Tax=Moorena sp. SIO4G3 TaxID=2607821 RepID=UPI00142BDF0F|nr:DUF3747 domain-containing protein [Moorena sp. SIO4G3]NEO81007.1 DUF3747 domain-containing protein [Moorena sp. SIO4G3]